MAPTKRSRSKSAARVSTDKSTGSAVVKDTKAVHNEGHKEVDYEFGGPVGALATMVGLPVVIYGLYFLCDAETCLHNPLSFDWHKWTNAIPTDGSAYFRCVCASLSPRCASSLSLTPRISRLPPPTPLSPLLLPLLLEGNFFLGGEEQ